jgi:exonuclease SbcC
MAESKTLQQQVAALKKSLVDTQKQLDAFDAREKSVTAARTETQVLDNRISDGKAKIAEQQKRVEEAEKALAIMEKSRKGKEAFEAAESTLKSLREQDKLRRAIEKDITALDKDCSRLTQSLAHELREINQTDLQLAAEEARLNKDRQALSADENVTRQAARLPELRKEVEQLRSARGLLEGRRAGLLEGKDKLAAGVCPFFQEPCQNIAGRVPRDVFTARVEELDTESRAFTKRIAGLDSLLRIAEKAQQQLDSIQVRGQELDKQRKALGKRRDENSTRRQKLEHIRAQQAEAEEKAADRKKELEKYRNLDAEIPQVEKLRTEHQAARDAFVANRKDAEDLINRRESLKKMAGLFEDLQKSHAIKQQELARLATEYDSQRHTELRLAKEKLVADSAAGKQKMDGLGKDRLRLETEITRLNRIRDEITVKLAEKKILLAREELVRFLRTRIFNHVSAQLSERFREEISLRADTIYRNIAETDEELYWGDKYRIVLRDMRDGKLRERSDDQLSGGQIMSAVVALRLALLQTIGARIAFFDEPTSNLDAARRENLAHAFRAIDVGREEVTEHWYDQLFLISHDVAFTEVTDQVISLDHNEGDR